MSARQVFLATLVLAGAGVLAVAPAAAAGNLVNTPFATISDGLLAPVIVDVPTGATRAQIDRAISAALRRTGPSRAGSSGAYDFLVRHRLLRPGSMLSFPRIVVLRQGGVLRLPELERAQRTRSRLGGGEITFTYENWAMADAQQLDQFVQLMYPIAKEVYGRPSANINLRIVRDDTLTDASMHLRNGIYNASANEIRFNPTGNFVDDTYFLTHLVLYAFHDDAMFAYDSWEEGFTWAATYVIFKRLRGDYDLGESFKTFYFLPFYELLNQPGIGNVRFWPPSFDQIVATERSAVFPFTMFVFRSGMAGAAWVKAYIENNAFFRLFNEAYYQQFAPGISGHIPTLKAIATSVVPTVEGLPFTDWYRRQLILDTAVTSTRQLWVWSLPQFDRADGAGAHLVLLLYHFNRDLVGNEFPLGGTADLLYYSWDFVQDYFAEEGNQATIPASGTDAGVGSFSPGIFNVGGAQKINVRVSVSGITRTVLWPYLVRGPEADPNDLFGVALNSETGRIGVTLGSGQEQVVPLSQGAFGLKAGLPGWTKTIIRVLEPEPGARSVTRQVNTGFDSYAVVLTGLRPEPATFTQTFAAGIHLMSVPAFPSTSDPEAFGIPAAKLRLAHWDPTLNTGDPGYRYRIYPATPPLAPGIGYWLFLSQPVTVSFQGNPLPQDQSHLIPLRVGWNQIGHPFLQDVPVEQLSVVTNAADPEQQAVDLQTAAAQGLISRTIWTYAAGQGYVAATRLEPWRGYWVRADADILLKVPAVAAPGQNPPSALPAGDTVVGDVRSRRASRGRASFGARSQGADGWQLRLSARCGETAGNVVVGAARAATDGFDPLHDAQQPPVATDYVRLRTHHPDWGRAAGDYAIDIRGLGAVRTTWDIELDTNQRNRDVVLSWSDLSDLPRDTRLFLTDLDGGQRRYLRTSRSLVVNSGETGRRRLRLEATRGTAGMLAITNITVLPTRAAGAMTVQFTLSADAVVDAQVLSPTGRTLRTLARSRASQVGANQVVWDGRNEASVRLGAGIYLLQLTATTEEGQSVRVSQPIVVVR